MSAIVDIARSWIGTPYIHQAAARGAGTDCLGLIRGIWAEVHGTDLPAAPAYSEDWAEPQGDEVLWRAARSHLIATEGEAAGDVLLFRMREAGVAKHLGVQSATGARPAFIHAYSGHGVVESPLSRPWRARIVARFRFPET